MKSKIVSMFIRLANLQLAIEAEQKRAAPDWMRLFRLKRLRLVLQDKIQTLKTAMMPAGAKAGSLALARVYQSRFSQSRRTTGRGV